MSPQTAEDLIKYLKRGHVDANELTKEQSDNLAVYFQLANRSRHNHE